MYLSCVYIAPPYTHSCVHPFILYCNFLFKNFPQTLSAHSTVSRVLGLHLRWVPGVSLCFSAPLTMGRGMYSWDCSASRDLAGLAFEPTLTKTVQLDPFALLFLPAVALPSVKCPLLIHREEKSPFCALSRSPISGNHENWRLRCFSILHCCTSNPWAWRTEPALFCSKGKTHAAASALRKAVLERNFCIITPNIINRKWLWLHSKACGDMPPAIQVIRKNKFVVMCDALWQPALSFTWGGHHFPHHFFSFCSSFELFLIHPLHCLLLQYSLTFNFFLSISYPYLFHCFSFVNIRFFLVFFISLFFFIQEESLGLDTLVFWHVKF